MRTRTERAIYRGLAATLVLGTLTAVLWPVFPGGFGQGPTIACLSRMKDLGSGTTLYALDHDETLPVAPGFQGPTVVGWASRVYSFVKAPKIFADPLERRATISYAMNANVVEIPRLAAIDRPERSVLLYEISDARLGRNGDLRATLRLSPEGDGAAGGLLDSIDPNLDPSVLPATGALANSGLNPRLKPRHRGKSIFVRVDGSARASLPEEVSAGANARAAEAAALSSGGRRPDLPGVDRPRASGTRRTTGGSTFSLR